MDKDVLARAAAIFASVALADCGGSQALPSIAGGSVASSTSATSTMSLAAAMAKGYIVTQCPTPAPGQVTCGEYHFTQAGLQALGIMRSVASSRRKSGAGYGTLAYNPLSYANSIQAIRQAYGLTSLSLSGGVGRTVAAIEVGDDASADSDLQVYRSAFGMPACTIANGCLRKVNQNGGSALPSPYAYWNDEVADDVDAISAVCPNCKILIVEAKSTNWSDVTTAVNTAAGMGIAAMDNSYGVGEDASMLQYASAYDHPGIPIVAAGSNQFDLVRAGLMSLPAAYSTVIAAGATALTADSSSSRGWSEAVDPWGAADGCSTIIAKPAWQHDVGCSMRTIVDVGFVTDETSYPRYASNLGWTNEGGNSAAAAAIAALYALAGAKVNDASSLYYGASQLNQVQGGAVTGVADGKGGCFPLSNANTGGQIVPMSSTRREASSGDLPGYFCTGTGGYNASSGNGTPFGVGVLTATPPPVSVCSAPTPTDVLSGTGVPNVHPTQRASGGGCAS
jgi:hypothetical protein